MGERRRARAEDPPAQEAADRAADPLAWLRDGPTLVRRMLMAEILGPPRAVRRKRWTRG